MNTLENIFVFDFKSQIDYSRFDLPMIIVYSHPSDFPDKFVARLFDLQRPTPYIAIADSLSDIRNIIPYPGRFHKMPRSKYDAPSITEVYM